MSSEEYILFIPTHVFFYGVFSSLIDKPFNFSTVPHGNVSFPPFNDIIRVSG